MNIILHKEVFIRERIQQFQIQEIYFIWISHQDQQQLLLQVLIYIKDHNLH